MAFSIEFLINRLEQEGLFNIILPFLLIFAIVYGILQKMPILGDNDKVNGVVAFVFGMYITVFSQFATYLTNMVAGGGVILVGLLFFLMIVGFGSSLSGGSPTSILSEHRDALTIAFMLIGGLLFVNSGGLLIVGAYAVRVGFQDILAVTFLYIIYIFIRNFLGGGNANYDKVKRLINRYNNLASQIEAAEDSDDDGLKKHLKSEQKRILAKIHKAGATDVKEDTGGYINAGQIAMYGYHGEPMYGYHGRRNRKRIW